MRSIEIIKKLLPYVEMEIKYLEEEVYLCWANKEMVEELKVAKKILEEANEFIDKSD